MFDTNNKIMLAFILGVILKILSNPWILGFYDENYSIHKNKVYDALIIGCLTGFIQIIINRDSLSNGIKFLWTIIFLTIFISIDHILNNQIFVSEKDLLLSLREKYAESIKFTDIQLKDDELDEEIRKFLIQENLNKISSIEKINKILLTISNKNKLVNKYLI